MAWLYCLKTLIADKSRRGIMQMGGLWARQERHAAIDKLKSVFVLQHSQDPNSQLQCCVFLVPNLLLRLLCIYQPVNFPLHAPATEKGEGKGRAGKGRRANKYLYCFFPPAFIHSSGRRTLLRGEWFLSTAVLTWQLYGEAVLGQEPNSSYLWFKNCYTGEWKTFPG